MKKTEDKDILTLRYVPLSQIQGWARNKKRHDIGSIVRSIERYGFKDPLKTEPTLNDGQGGIVEGNGREQALIMMKEQGMKRPRGIAEDKEGEWLVPVLFGVDAESQAMAESYGIDHNSLVLSGGNFEISDIMKLYEDDFAAQLKEMGEQEIELISLDAGDMESIVFHQENPYIENDEESYKKCKCPLCGSEHKLNNP